MKLFWIFIPIGVLSLLFAVFSEWSDSPISPVSYPTPSSPRGYLSSENLQIESSIQIPITASSWAMLFLEKAKEQIWVVKTYDYGNGYYSHGGSPPPETGVCTDVIWRAYRDIGIDFRANFQKDVESYPLLYDGDLDSNINYRRVKRLQVYFSRTAKVLTNSIVPNDLDTLKDWQPWDIVIFEELPSNHLWHIGIISDIRWVNGVPFMLDNHGQGVSIAITPLDWPTKVVGHFRPF